jgi:quinolinate synthase
VEGADEVDVDPETSRLARRSVQRMVQIGQPGGGE